MLKWVLRGLGWTLKLAFVGLFAFMAANCTMLGLNYASLDTGNKPEPTPPLAISDATSWEARKPGIRAMLEAEEYGPWPEGLAISFGETRVADPEYLNGAAVLEETAITLGTGDAARTFHLAIAWPKDAPQDGSTPVLIGQTFGSNCYLYTSMALTAPGGNPCQATTLKGFGGAMITGIFGEYIANLPVEDFISHGYAVANFYASELMPDAEGPAEEAMAALRESDGIASTGTIMFWSYGFTAAIDLLETDPRADLSRIAVWGHSRHAKSALVAAAFEPRIALVIAHQSGFGGAALSRSETGEGVAQMTGAKKPMMGTGYPHWFDPAFIEHAKHPDTLPFDQHFLLALIAPRPVLLGNGRRDVWSDPNSTFRSAEAASVAWDVEGADPDWASDMRDYRPASPLAYYMRGGGHGIVRADIDAFIAFLDAHFKRG